MNVGALVAKLLTPTPGMIGLSYLDLAYHFIVNLSILTSDILVITLDSTNIISDIFIIIIDEMRGNIRCRFPPKH